MSGILAVLIMSVVIICFVYTMKELHEMEQRQIQRQALHEDWLFQSLYSMNHSIQLPTDPIQPTINKKARVFSPSEDGMAEFNGQMDDL